MKRRKRVTIKLVVSVPVEMTASQARTEVRTLINDQSNYSAEPEDVRAISVRGTR